MVWHSECVFKYRHVITNHAVVQSMKSQMFSFSDYIYCFIDKCRIIQNCVLDGFYFFYLDVTMATCTTKFLGFIVHVFSGFLDEKMFKFVNEQFWLSLTFIEVCLLKGKHFFVCVLYQV